MFSPDPMAGYPEETRSPQEPEYLMCAQVSPVSETRDPSYSLDHVDLRHLSRDELRSLARIEHAYMFQMGLRRDVDISPEVRAAIMGSRQRLHHIKSELFERDEMGLGSKNDHGAFTKERLYLEEGETIKGPDEKKEGKTVELDYHDLKEEEGQRLEDEANNLGLSTDEPVHVLRYSGIKEIKDVLHRDSDIPESVGRKFLRERSTPLAKKRKPLLETLGDMYTSARAALRKWKRPARRAAGIGGVVAAASASIPHNAQAQYIDRGFTQIAENAIQAVDKMVAEKPSPWVQHASPETQAAALPKMEEPVKQIPVKREVREKMSPAPQPVAKASSDVSPWALDAQKAKQAPEPKGFWARAKSKVVSKVKSWFGR